MLPSLTSQGSRIGRDPNDATWVLVRHADDWAPPAEAPADRRRPVAGAVLDGLAQDPLRSVVELDGAGPRANERWLFLDPIIALDGWRYRSDPARDLVLAAEPCSEDFQPLPCFGGSGHATGRLSRPLGLAAGPRGLLYVADADNHRVQVVDPRGGEVVVVLGATDDWGQPLAGRDGGAMQEPVHVAVDPRTGRVFVADRSGGRIHVFDGSFRYQRSFVATPGIARVDTPRPVALHVLPDGSLLVFDPGWPRYIHVDALGDTLADLPFDAVEGTPWPAPVARFVPHGEAVVGPIDGGHHDLAWHRVILQADLPPGTSIQIQTFASNEVTAAPSRMAWAPASPVRFPAETDRPGQGHDRLVLGDQTRWIRHEHGPYGRDRPLVHRFERRGAASTLQVQLPPEAAAWLRVSDRIEVEANGSRRPSTVTQIPESAVWVVATGEHGDFGPGTSASIASAQGELLAGPREIHTLGATQTVHVGAASRPGRPILVSLPHAIGALLSNSDEIVLQDGARIARLAVVDVVQADVVVELTDPVDLDADDAALYLIRAAGRLVIEDLAGFETQAPADEPLTLERYDEPADAWRRVQVGLRYIHRATRTLLISPILSPDITTDSWERLSTAAPAATDRGRYLWLRMRVYGARPSSGASFALSTPSVHSLRVLAPRLSYLSYLPALFSRRDPHEDPPGALFLERFLALFEHELTAVEAWYEDVSRLLNPEAADQEWVDFMATWVGLVFDPTWDLTRRRTLLIEVADLYRCRGTPAGLRRYLEIYLGRSPEIIEGYQAKPSSPLVLGRAGRLGCSHLSGPPEAPRDCALEQDRFAHRFTLIVYLDCEEALETTASTVERIVEVVKPAHTLAHVRFVLPQARVGLESTIGVDMVLGQPSIGIELGRGASGPGSLPHPTLGVDTIVSHGRHSSGPRPSRLQDTGAPIDGSFTL